MNICFVSDSYPTLGRHGGIAIYTQNAARGLAARGHHVHVVVGRHGLPFDAQDGQVHLHVRSVRWIPVLGRWLAGLGESICLALALKKLQRMYGFDIIEFPNWEAPGLIPALCRIAPIVVRLHTSTAESIAARGTPPSFAERFLVWAEKMSARLAVTTVTHSYAHAAHLGTAYGLVNTKVIPHGIEIPDRVAVAPLTSSQLVLCVGSLSSRKGTGTLFGAIPRVLDRVARATFLLVGIDPQHKYETLFRNSYPHITSEQVQFLGFVEEKTLAQLYSQCAIYASASVYESFGLTFVEAMARGKPAVGCNVSAMPEIIEHEQTGLLVPPNDPRLFADAIIRLLQDPELSRAMGKAARHTAEQKYSALRMAETIEQFYLQVVHGA